MTTRVGIVGLGAMGAPMAERVLANGLPLTVYARRPEVATPFGDVGARVARSLRDLARGADVVVVCVFSDDQVRELAFADGLVEALEPAAVLAIHTTGSPVTAEALGVAAATRGAHVIDAPVSGGPASVRARTLTLLVGGDADAVEHARPALECYADPILHLGALGNGQRVKLVNNALFTAQVQLGVEAIQLGVALGIDPAALTAALEHCSGASYAVGMLGSMGPSDDALDAIRQFMRKDLDVAKDVAAALGADLGALGQVADRLFD